MDNSVFYSCERHTFLWKTADFPPRCAVSATSPLGMNANMIFLLYICSLESAIYCILYISFSPVRHPKQQLWKCSGGCRRLLLLFLPPLFGVKWMFSFEVSWYDLIVNCFKRTGRQEDSAWCSMQRVETANGCFWETAWKGCEAPPAWFVYQSP